MSSTLRDQEHNYHSSHEDPFKRSRGLHRNCILAPYEAGWSTPHQHDRDAPAPPLTKPSARRIENILKVADSHSCREPPTTLNSCPPSKIQSESDKFGTRLPWPHAVGAPSTRHPTPQTSPSCHPAAGKFTHITTSFAHSSPPSKVYFGWR
jgi:hypothetical protein